MGYLLPQDRRQKPAAIRTKLIAHRKPNVVPSRIILSAEILNIIYVLRRYTVFMFYDHDQIIRSEIVSKPYVLRSCLKLLAWLAEQVAGAQRPCGKARVRQGGTPPA
jgi:hypothetical protein